MTQCDSVTLLVTIMNIPAWQWESASSPTSPPSRPCSDEARPPSTSPAWPRLCLMLTGFPPPRSTCPGDPATPWTPPAGTASTPGPTPPGSPGSQPPPPPPPLFYLTFYFRFSSASRLTERKKQFVESREKSDLESFEFDPSNIYQMIEERG